MQRKLQQIAGSIRAPPYLPERMFPQLRQRIGPALDVIVEFSTLGEYRLGADGVVYPASAFAPATEQAPQLGGAGDHPVALRAAVRQIVAGGAVGSPPAATPAARRAGAPARPVPARSGGTRAASPASLRPADDCSAPRPHVAGHEQLCLAV
jgi:hypothetical protein